MTPAQKAVARELADRADDAGRSFASHAGIAEATCLGRTAVIEALKALRTMGAVTWSPKEGSQRNNYDLQLGWLGGEIRRLASTELDRRGTLRPELKNAVETVEGWSDSRNPSGNRTGTADEQVRQTDTPRPADEQVPVREPDHPVRQAYTNHQEPSVEPSLNQKKSAQAHATLASVLLPDVDPQAVKDWGSVRKAKRAGDINPSVIKILYREAAKAELAVEAAILLCIEYGWQNFNAGWYAERQQRSRTPAQSFRQQDAVAAASRVHELSGGLVSDKRLMNRGGAVIDITPRRGKHSGFDQLDYHAGINEDGSIT
jgi:hypothetical protein